MIYLDADACPVKAEAERVATRLGIRLLIVSNGGLRPSANPLVEMVYVPQGPDEADKWIAERAGPGDVVVTGDIPLAAKCVAAGARVRPPTSLRVCCGPPDKSPFGGPCAGSVSPHCNKVQGIS